MPLNPTLPLNVTLPAAESAPAGPLGAVETPDSFATGQSCPQCGAGEYYNKRYDAGYCPACNCWLESVCSDRGCAYCRQRPARPLNCQFPVSEFIIGEPHAL